MNGHFCQIRWPWCVCGCAMHVRSCDCGCSMAELDNGTDKSPTHTGPIGSGIGAFPYDGRYAGSYRNTLGKTE